MMTSVKYVLPTLAIVFCSHTTWASIETHNTSNVLDKVSIFGHTGQDPARRSYVGNPKRILPYNDTSIDSRINTFNLKAMLLDQVLDLIDWRIAFDDPASTTAITINQPLWDRLAPIRLKVSFNTPRRGGSIPAPPAFLLLLTGTAIRRRRTYM